MSEQHVKKLPHWVLTDSQKAFYDSEAATVIQQTAKIYASQQELINEYNQFVDEINNHIEQWENGLYGEFEEFKADIQTITDRYAELITIYDGLQQQIDQLVIEGDSSVEAAQARVSTNNDNESVTYTTLKERLDSEYNKLDGDIVNVKSFGAKGDGVTDDYNAIQTAINALSDRCNRLYFPSGQYLIGRGEGRTNNGGLTIVDKSNIEIRFNHDAVLLMDNLNDSSSGDQTHGILICGDCDNIRLINPHVQWKVTPATRSLGDGIRLLGGNDPETCPRNIQIVNAYVEKAPQAGITFYGCRDISLKGAKIIETLADGVHANACFQNIFIDNVYVKNSGDDGVAFVTYYSETPTNTTPFVSNTHDARNNNHSRATNIVVDGGKANGIRVAGGYDILIDHVQVKNKATAAITIDSTIADGTTYKWTYLASRKITIDNVHSLNNPSGIVVKTLNVSEASLIDGTELDDFRKFDVYIQSLKESGCTEDGLYIESSSHVNVNYMNVSRRARLRNVSNIHIQKADVYGLFGVYGSSDGYSDPLQTNTPEHNIKIGELNVYGNEIIFQSARNIEINKIYSFESPVSACNLNQIIDCYINYLHIIRPNRNNSTSAGSMRGLSVSGSANVIVNEYQLNTDNIEPRSLEIGGGTATRSTENIHIRNMMYINELNQTDPDIILQGGTYAPKNYSINCKYYNGGETTPLWRYYQTADEANGSTRPSKPTTGQSFYDTNINKPIWYNGSEWKDASGTSV